MVIHAYGPFGENGTTAPNRFGYTGQQYIAGLGLYYYKARWYSPTVGRFLETDPIGYGDGVNWYAYVGNNPVNWRDPRGLSAADAAMLSSTASESGSQLDWSKGVQVAVGPLLPLLGLGMIANEIATSDVPIIGGGVAKGAIAGGGARLENLGASEITRIQNAANRSGQEISVVGSRAGGMAKPASDWDYVIDANAKTRNSLSSSLPGAGNTAEGIRPNLDVFKGQVDETRPFIRFFPE
ncbi:hypothetical protein NTGHW29_150071 [Candidatus Nitrotoga sp. HW29]|nr:hypothetical protein NTGHW29_150071 [Candidatus Nitrotoga sp. HW29]